MSSQKSSKVRTFILLIIAAVLSALNSAVEWTAWVRIKSQAESGVRQGTLTKAGGGQAVPAASAGTNAASADPHLIAAIFCLLFFAACAVGAVYVYRKKIRG